jgi:hypothetical protein
MALKQQQATLSEAQLTLPGRESVRRRPDDAPRGRLTALDEESRAKVRHLDDDPRVALIVVDPSDPYKWVSISGATDVTTEGADKQIDELAKKYLGEDRYPWASPDKRRLKVLIQPAHVDSSGFD